MSNYNYYKNRAKKTYTTAKNGAKSGVSFAKRVKENYDIVLITLGCVIVAGALGYPITSKTTSTTISNNKI